jgi:uncharacterized protein (DUF1800 family)
MAPSALQSLDELNPVDAWKPWEPTDKEPFNQKWAGHLYRRAGFGATLTELREAEKRGLAATIDLLIKGEPGADELAIWLNDAGFKEKKDEGGGMGTGAGSRARYKPNFFGQFDAYEIRAWWLYCMLFGKHPLREKMALFWHNHFATSIAKVKFPWLMVKQNILIRNKALGKFGPFLLDMSKDAAMIAWLDNNSNVKGHPNENYAREVMELFSLGVGHYTEADIREAARAFTGWHTDGDDKYFFDVRYHDDGAKTVLDRTGKLKGEDVIDILLGRADTAQFIVKKLYTYLVSENQSPPARFLEPLAESFRKSDYDIAALVRTMLSSRHFFSEYAYQQRIKCPVELVLGAIRETADVPALAEKKSKEERAWLDVVAKRIDGMGQVLFAPPNVKGWPGGQTWLNTSTVLARQNFAQALAMATIWTEPPLSQPQPFQRDVEPTLPPGAKRPVRPEEPPPPKEQDPARIVKAENATAPEEVVRVLLDVYLPGGVAESARKRLVAFVADGSPKDAALDRRVRETVHAILSMSEYQMA